MEIKRPCDNKSAPKDYRRKFHHKRQRKNEIIEASATSPTAQESLFVASARIRRSPLFVGGRYLKLERGISQSQWLINGKPKTELNIADCISEPLKIAYNADECGFVAAGREDADVRMLGSGRPFFIEIRNARKTVVDIEEIQKLINSTYGGSIQVDELRSISRDATKLVKEGEELKAKRYTCLVWAKRIERDKLLELQNMTDIQLIQKTPVRVLHRRPNLSRQKLIHWIKASPLDDHFMQVELETQAGTYIKEFITGDMGRTAPSFGTLLGTVTDILELDVTHVELDWPPSPKEETV